MRTIFKDKLPKSNDLVLTFSDETIRFKEQAVAVLWLCEICSDKTLLSLTEDEDGTRKATLHAGNLRDVGFEVTINE